MNHAFLRIVQGLFAAALLFQGFEYFQKPEYVKSDMPILENRLSNAAIEYRRVKREQKAQERQKRLEKEKGEQAPGEKPAKPAKPKAAQAPELRLFPKPGDRKAKPEKAATPDKPASPDPVAVTPPAAPIPAPVPVPAPAEEEHGPVDYLQKGLDAEIYPIGFDQAVEASIDPIILILDARDKNIYDLGHIPGAKSVPYETAARDGLKGLLETYTESFTRPTMVYCGDKFCSKAFELSQYLVELGLPKSEILFYADGFADYSANGGELESVLGTPAVAPSPPNAPAPGFDATARPPAGIVPAASALPAAPPVPTTKAGLNGARVKALFASEDYFQISKFVVPCCFLLLGLIAMMLPVGAFTWLLRICLAVLFIYAGYVKMKAPAEFMQNIACYLQVPSVYVNQVAFVLPPLEILAGVALLVPYFRHAGAFLILCMLCMFIGATGMALWQGLEIDCGCGAVSKPLEWSKIAKNSIYALGCLGLLFYQPKIKQLVAGPGRR